MVKFTVVTHEVPADTSRQQTIETRVPRPTLPWKPAIVDCCCERNGSAGKFPAFAPSESRDASRRRTAARPPTGRDSSATSPTPFPRQENRAGHGQPGIALRRIACEAFDPDETSRLRNRFEFRYAMKRGSWPDMAEIENGEVPRRCPNRRIPDRKTVRRWVAACARGRNERAKTINWRITTEIARIKLKSLYPSFHKS